MGASHLRSVIIAAVNAGRDTHAEILASLKAHVSGKAADALIAKMIHERLLLQKPKGRYGVTPKGARLLPSVQAPLPGGDYVPPVPPPRRAGSMDYAKWPSVEGGVARPWRATC